MALIICIKCGHAYDAARAFVCPKCGHPKPKGSK